MGTPVKIWRTSWRPGASVDRFLIQATAPFRPRRPEGQRLAARRRARDCENGKRPDLGKTPAKKPAPDWGHPVPLIAAPVSFLKDFPLTYRLGKSGAEHAVASRAKNG
jgi:hypothetical protein